MNKYNNTLNNKNINETFASVCKNDKFSYSQKDLYSNIFKNYTNVNVLKKDIKMIESIDELGKSIQELDQIIIKYGLEGKIIEHWSPADLINRAHRVASDIKNRFQNIKNHLVNSGNNYYNRTVNAAKNEVNRLKDSANRIYNQANSWATTKINQGLAAYDKHLSDSVNGMINQVKDIGNQIKDGATKAYSDASNVVDQAKNGAMGALNTVQNTANNTMNQIESGVNSTLNTIEGGFNSSISTMEKGFNDTVNTIESGATSAMNEVAEGTMGTFDAMEDGVMGAFDQAKGGLNEALGFVKNLPNMIPMPKQSKRKNVESGMKKANEEGQLETVLPIPGTNLEMEKINKAAEQSGINTDPTGTSVKPTLIHSYTFEGDTNDKIPLNSKNGQLIGDDVEILENSLLFNSNSITSKSYLTFDYNILENQNIVSIELLVTTKNDDNKNSSRILQIGKEDNENSIFLHYWNEEDMFKGNLSLTVTPKTGDSEFITNTDTKFNELDNSRIILVLNGEKNEAKLYVNSVLVGTLNPKFKLIDVMTDTSKIYIGKSFNPNDSGFSGKINELNIWRNELVPNNEFFTNLENKKLNFCNNQNNEYVNYHIDFSTKYVLLLLLIFILLFTFLLLEII